MTLKVFFGAAALALLSSAGLAAPVVYDCNLSKGPRGSWIGDRAIFWVDDVAGTARVIDGVVNYVFGEPIEAKFEKRPGGSYLFSWKIEDAPGSRGEARVNFSAFLRPDNKRVTINAALPAYDNTSSGRGRCELIDQ
ncbi:MAG: hypothetical protein HRU31_04955 [Rhodobacteraceae bacterium]|nr:hypothetical protein [Paracoccaceae bacterium]